MALMGIEFRSDGFDYRTFACSTCDRVETRAIASEAKEVEPVGLGESKIHSI